MFDFVTYFATDIYDKIYNNTNIVAFFILLVSIWINSIAGRRLSAEIESYSIQVFDGLEAILKEYLEINLIIVKYYLIPISKKLGIK